MFQFCKTFLDAICVTLDSVTLSANVCIYKEHVFGTFLNTCMELHQDGFNSAGNLVLMYLFKAKNLFLFQHKLGLKSELLLRMNFCALTTLIRPDPMFGLVKLVFGQELDLCKNTKWRYSAGCKVTIYPKEAAEGGISACALGWCNIMDIV